MAPEWTANGVPNGAQMVPKLKTKVRTNYGAHPRHVVYAGKSLKQITGQLRGNYGAITGELGDNYGAMTGQLRVCYGSVTGPLRIR